MRMKLAVSIWALSLLVFPLSLVHAADGCTRPNDVKAKTQADIDRMRALGLPEELLVIGQCWDPTQRVDATQAKLELGQMWCQSKDTCGGHITDVEHLSDQFATCMVGFLKQYRQKDASTCIYSAFRSDEFQRCKCGDTGGAGCLGPGRSKHNIGLAVDLRVRNYPDMHAAAIAYNGGGLTNINVPSDPYHVEADRSGRCGAGTLSPVGPLSPQQQSPFQNAMSAIRNLFSPPPPPIVPPPPINPVYDPTQYFSSSTPYASSTPPSNYPIDTSQDSTTTPKTVSDLIEALAAPPPSITKGATGTPIELNDSIGNVAGLKPGERPRGTATGSIAISSLTPDNTFTSQDLSKTPAQNILRGNSTFVLLEGLKQALLKLLSIFKPFGGRTIRSPAPAVMPVEFAE